jgi:hypothetical protein
MSDSLSDLDRFRSALFEPASFRERGVTVPFTTPLLLNARIRRSTSGQGLELVAVNPSGGRGMLIIPWPMMTEICSPTLFDRQLWEILGKATDISPIGIRHEAQRLAAQGLAGRSAALAARDAQRREVSCQRLIKTMLLESLISAAETSAEAAGRSNDPDDAEFLKRAERAVARSAKIAGLPLSKFSADLDDLADALSGTTPQIGLEDARLRRMLDSLDQMTNEIASWAAGQSADSTQLQAAHFVQQTARQTVQCTRIALAATDNLIADLGLFVPGWRGEWENILECARGPDWVLDGWKTPMALWGAAEASQRGAAIWEMALIAPILPREAKAWLPNAKNESETPRRTTQVVRDRADWRSGDVTELVARNENLISFSITYENRIKPLKRSWSKLRLPQATDDRNVTTRWRLTKPTLDSEAASGNRKEAQNTAFSNTIQAKVNILSEARGLGESIETSSDETLAKIVALVDRLSNAEVHERLLGPSLPRLKRLRPPRPASLMRLVFLPLSGALIDPTQWGRSAGRIPRNAISPLMEALKLVLGPNLDALALELRGGKLEDTRLIDSAGRTLWRVASEAKPRMLPGPSWALSGFTEKDFDAMTSLADGLWRHASPLWDGMQQISGECSPDILHAALAGPAQEGRFVFAAALNALLQRASRPSILLTIHKHFGPQMASVIEETINDWVATTLQTLMEDDFETGVHLAAEIGAVLSTLETLPKLNTRQLTSMLPTHKRNLDQFCRTTYRELVMVHITQPLLDMPPDQSDILEEIEAMARLARRMEDTGRRLGSQQVYLAVQEEFSAQMRKLLRSENTSVSEQEIARIEEVLVGRESAERLLYRFRR